MSGVLDLINLLNFHSKISIIKRGNIDQLKIFLLVFKCVTSLRICMLKLLPHLFFFTFLNYEIHIKKVQKTKLNCLIKS